MTEREGALRALANSTPRNAPMCLRCSTSAIASLLRLLDKWFAAQAGSICDDTIETAPRLLAHPDFTLSHPGRLGAVVGSFTANLHAFHHPSGRGYRFLADVAMVADRIDPEAAARMIGSPADWRRFEPARASLMKAQLERIVAGARLFGCACERRRRARRLAHPTSRKLWGSAASVGVR